MARHKIVAEVINKISSLSRNPGTGRESIISQIRQREPDSFPRRGKQSVNRNLETACKENQFHVRDPSRAGLNVFDDVARYVPTHPLTLCRERSLRQPSLIAKAAKLRADDVSRVRGHEPTEVGHQP